MVNQSGGSQSSWMLATAVCCCCAVSLAVAWRRWQYERHATDMSASSWSQRRREERTGRIRAEIRLRTTLKQMQQLQQQLSMMQQHLSTAGSNGQPQSETCVVREFQCSPNNPRTMLLRCIGTVVSPFTKRMGTPRQGALVPAGRGYVQLEASVPVETASGLELYSHVWIVFEFHANTDLATSPATSNGFTRAKKTKVRPPRGGGVKVGQLATRSPHRPNPLGLSLVSVAQWEPGKRRLHVRGLDLVHGTPVYDIKPAVPWDVPGYFNNPGTEAMSCLRVPEWVSGTDDTLGRVEWSDEALVQLQHCLDSGALAPLYTNDNDGLRGAVDTLQQVLAQDPRSSHKGVTNARGSKDSTCYSLIFCATKVSFTVAEDSCLVNEVVPVHFDENQYVDGVPLISDFLD